MSADLDRFDFENKDGTKSSCKIIETKKKGSYWYATAECSDGSIHTEYSSNVNVAKALACQHCEDK